MPTYETDDVNDPYHQFLRSRHFYNLDWLRGIAILLVLAHHIPNWGGDYFSTLRDNGRYGVSLFFGISGFLICRC
jgi:peptidoglycan/LPS O-acetylase OafA/YrhL